MRMGRILVAAALAVTLVSCGDDQPAAVTFTRVDLPSGARPVALAASGDDLLIGVRRPGQPVEPALLRRGRDGAVSELPVRALSPYALVAGWVSIGADGDRIVAIGGERGGAHGNVRWSVWNGSAAGLTEQVQAFSTFGGYGAGELYDVVITPEGPAIVGTWESPTAGFDLALWTNEGDTWTRQTSSEPALASTRDLLGFPIAATALGQGILTVGWQLAGGAQQAVAWRSSSGITGWTRTALPETGADPSANAVRCTGDACAATGRSDGKLAIWRLTGDTWSRLPNVPPVPVGDRDKLTGVLDLDGHLVQAIAENGQVKILRGDGDRWTVRAAAGPSGSVTAAVRVGNEVYLVAGADENSQTLWRADVGALSGGD
jgi:hypothetical protein